MKKTLLFILGSVAIVVATVYAQTTGLLPYLDNAGLHVGTTAGKMGFFGVTPVTQPTISSAGTTTGSAAATASVSPSVVAGATQAVLTLETCLATNSAGAEVSVVTNVTINAVYGFASSQATITTVVGAVTVAGGKYGYTTSAQADGIVTQVNTQRTAMVNSGLAK